MGIQYFLNLTWLLLFYFLGLFVLFYMSYFMIPCKRNHLLYLLLLLHFLGHMEYKTFHGPMVMCEASGCLCLILTSAKYLGGVISVGILVLELWRVCNRVMWVVVRFLLITLPMMTCSINKLATTRLLQACYNLVTTDFLHTSTLHYILATRSLRTCHYSTTVASVVTL